MHPTLTPLADDVNFRQLAETYEVSGGDIRNAVLKAALSAASEPLRDTAKIIHHRHLDEGIRDVIAGKRVMKQSLFDGGNQPGATNLPVVSDPRLMLIAVDLGATALIVALVALLAAFR
jgi:hypothetical protein